MNRILRVKGKPTREFDYTIPLSFDERIDLDVRGVEEIRNQDLLMQLIGTDQFEYVMIQDSSRGRYRLAVWV